MSFAIRDADLADPRDAAAIVALVDSYASGSFGGGAPLPERVRADLVAGLRAHPTTLVLVAFDTGELALDTGELALDTGEAVGIAICFFGFSTFRARPLLNIHDLAVVPAAQGRGIGRALLAAAELRARAHGCCKLTLEVLDDNQRARGLYASVGLAEVAVASSAFTRFLSKPLEATR